MNINKNKIIIALNRFENPNSLAQYGASLAKQLDRKATLTSVAKTPLLTTSTGTTGTATASNFAVAQMVRTKNQLEIDLNSISLESKKIWREIDYDVEVGFLEPTLIQKAKEESPFLFLIEGSNKLTTIGEWFGTYETRLAEKIVVPTLVVPEQYFWKPVQNILYVLKMEDSKSRNIRVLQNIARELNANLHVMIVADEDSAKNLKDFEHLVSILESFYEYQGIQYHFAEDLHSAKEIKKMTDEMEINWLAFEHEGQSFIEHIFSTISTERIILQAEIPVLVF